MPGPSDYLENAKEMMRQAVTAPNEFERDAYLRLAAAWNRLAEDAEAWERKGPGIIPFKGREPNPLADDSDF